jgi:hypothetical protein
MRRAVSKRRAINLASSHAPFATANVSPINDLRGAHDALPLDAIVRLRHSERICVVL